MCTVAATTRPTEAKIQKPTERKPGDEYVINLHQRTSVVQHSIPNENVGRLFMLLNEKRAKIKYQFPFT